VLADAIEFLLDLLRRVHEGMLKAPDCIPDLSIAKAPEPTHVQRGSLVLQNPYCGDVLLVESDEN
jgi:hypothetical protein